MATGPNPQSSSDTSEDDADITNTQVSGYVYTRYTQSSFSICLKTYDNAVALFLLQAMLSRFRVYELKSVLRDLSLPTNGRKNDLYLRALKHLHLRTPKISRYIKELYYANFRRPGVKSPVRSPVKHSSPSQLSQGSAHIRHPDVCFKPLPFYHVIDSLIRATSLGEQRRERERERKRERKRERERERKRERERCCSKSLISLYHLAPNTPSNQRYSQKHMWMQFHLTPQQLQLIAKSK